MIISLLRFLRVRGSFEYACKAKMLCRAQFPERFLFVFMYWNLLVVSFYVELTATLASRSENLCESARKIWKWQLQIKWSHATKLFLKHKKSLLFASVGPWWIIHLEHSQTKAWWVFISKLFAPENNL